MELKPIEDYFALVHHIIKKCFSKFKGKDCYEDIIQEGYLGLVEAYNRYDRSSNNEFSTYAHSYIKGYIMTYFRSKHYLMKLPNMCMVSKENLTDEAKCLIDAVCGVKCLNAEVASEASVVLNDIVVNRDERLIEDVVESRMLLNDILDTFNEDEMYLFKLRFIQGKYIDDIAKQIDCSHGTVCNRIAAIAEKARKVINGVKVSKDAIIFTSYTKEYSEDCIDESTGEYIGKKKRGARDKERKIDKGKNDAIIYFYFESTQSICDISKLLKLDKKEIIERLVDMLGMNTSEDIEKLECKLDSMTYDERHIYIKSKEGSN